MPAPWGRYGQALRPHMNSALDSSLCQARLLHYGVPGALLAWPAHRMSKARPLPPPIPASARHACRLAEPLSHSGLTSNCPTAQVRGMRAGSSCTLPVTAHTYRRSLGSYACPRCAGRKNNINGRNFVVVLSTSSRVVRVASETWNYPPRARA
ncbi:hypothetical protein BS50DRAFT_362840 [Corynespora cassiicola Philippines]|uniref:Uncharacterized protein n=1 Tax=Corynespora cassiicola Philippines TaxID=1448308 RepID=A0A2T2NSK8_CORCC|nr:hypothetical protein BS50DRAFT_362840 [Corynespora cassiicola Philippines]